MDCEILRQREYNGDMSIAICPGSYDPITFGHLDVIERTSKMFDEVVVLVAHNAKKKYLFTDDERLASAREALAFLPNIRVELIYGLVAEYAKSIRADAIVKGLRGPADYDAEQAMALLNRHLSGVETIFVMGSSTLMHVASSFVKDVALHGGPIRDLVPVNVARLLEEKVKNNG